MAFDFKNTPSSGGGSAFDNGPSVPQRKPQSGGGFQIPQSERSAGNKPSGGKLDLPTMRNLPPAGSRPLDRPARRNWQSGFSGADIPWKLIFYVLTIVAVVVLLVVFWDVIYALMMNILSFLLFLVILLAVLRFLLRRR